MTYTLSSIASSQLSDLNRSHIKQVLKQKLKIKIIKNHFTTILNFVYHIFKAKLTPQTQFIKQVTFIITNNIV